MCAQTPIVLIRGFLREQRHWGDFYQQIKQCFLGRPVICIDLAGNGKRNQVTSPDTIYDMVQDLRIQLKLYELNPPIDIIAISMGGMIAIEWMVQFPHEVRSALLINTSVRPLSPFYYRLNWRQYPTIIKAFLSKPEQQEAQILALTSNCQHENTELLKKWIKWKQQYPLLKSNVINQLRAAARYQISQRPDQAVMLVASRYDKLVNCQCSRTLALHWQWPIKIHPCAGHDLPLDDPRWLCRVAKQFFEQINSTLSHKC